MTKLFKPLKIKGVSPDGRISPGDSGSYYENHIEPFANISRFIKLQGSIAGIQIARAGRKALTLLAADIQHILSGNVQPGPPNALSLQIGSMVSQLRRYRNDIISEEIQALRETRMVYHWMFDWVWQAHRQARS